MDFNQPTDANSEKKIMKKELEFCERFFIDQLVKDFPDHLDLVINYISNKSSEINGFKEKQALTEVTKKLSSSKFSITEQFKTLLRKHIKNKIEAKSLLDIKLNWDKIHFTEEENSLENTTIINFKNILKKALGDDLIKVLNYTNFLVGDTKNIFSEDLLSQALSNTLKGAFSSMNSFCLSIDAFAHTWAVHLPLYYAELRKHLEENGIDQKIKQADIEAANILNNIPKSRISEDPKTEKEIESSSNFIAVPSMFSVGDVDLDAFLRALPPAPKIAKKEDSVLSVSDAGNLDINDISHLPKITPSLDSNNNNETQEVTEKNPESKQFDSSSELINEVKLNPSIAPNNGVNNASTLSAIDALAQHGNIQVIVVQGQSGSLENVVSAINNGNDNNNGGGITIINPSNGSGEYTEGYDGPREAPIDPEVARELAIQKIASDINKALLSQQRIDPIDFFSLLKKDLVVPEIAENESKIILLPRFLQTLKDVQSKFLKVNLEIFKKTKIFKKSIFLEILKNKLFAENVNYYDIFVLRLMAKTYQALFENENISQYQKLILFKTQLWVLHVALSDQSFWYFKDNPARILFDFIINPELQNNKPLIEQFDNVIRTIDATGQINSDFFISLIQELKQEINNNFEIQKELFTDKTKSLEKDEWFTFAYAKVSEQVMSITNNCEYEPIKDFAEKIWPYKFLQKLSKMTSLTIFDLPDFTKVLPANMKSMLNQHFIVFDALVTLANNKDGSKNQMEKLKKFISKANEGLATLAFDLDIDPRLTRALFSFVKYKLDVISQTTNPIAIQNSMNKISSNENAFKKEINSMVNDNLSYIRTNREIAEQQYELEKFLKLSHWYTINEDLLKLLHITKRKDYYIFLDMLKNEIRIINKPTIWDFIKKDSITNLTDESLQLNMLNFLVEYNLEIANSHIEHATRESSGETNEKESN